MQISSKSNIFRTLLTTLIAIVAAVSASFSMAAKPFKQNFAFESVGFFIGECNGFSILNDAHVEGHFIAHTDNLGNPTMTNLILKVSNSIYYNSNQPGLNLPGGPGETEVHFFDADGDKITAVPFKVTVPGHGVIFHDSGKVMFDNSGNVQFLAGPSDFTTGNVEALCEALSP